MIKLLREQISSLERDKIWLREQLEEILSREPESETITPIPDQDFYVPVGGVELPSERRKRLTEKYRRKPERKESNE